MHSLCQSLSLQWCNRFEKRAIYAISFKYKGDGNNCVTVVCSGEVRRERATVRFTIYNQIGCVCVLVCLHYAPHQYTCRSVERSNDVHEVLSLITRSASAPAARTIVVCLPISFVAPSAKCPFVYITAMHSALLSAIVSSTVCRLSLNYEWVLDNAHLEDFAIKLL